MRSCHRGVGFERIVKPQDLHSVVIYTVYVLNSEQLVIKTLNKCEITLNICSAVFPFAPRDTMARAEEMLIGE